MNIRKLQPKDLNSLAALYRQFRDEASDIECMLLKYKELVEHPDYLFLCAVAETRIVGTVMGVVCHSLYGDCRPFLLMEDMVVDKTVHRQGIGSALMRRLEAFARDKHCTQILFITENSRPQAVAFYESLGYNAETHVGFKKKL